jgi:hypothetical protein
MCSYVLEYALIIITQIAVVVIEHEHYEKVLFKILETQSCMIITLDIFSISWLNYRSNTISNTF